MRCVMKSPRPDLSGPLLTVQKLEENIMNSSLFPSPPHNAENLDKLAWLGQLGEIRELLVLKV